MRISMQHTHYTDSYDVIIERASDDLNIVEVAEMLRAALVGFGFHPDTVEQLLPRD